MTRPLQVFLERDDYDRLEAWARARGWTKSRAVRAAIRALTHRPSTDPLLDLSGDIDALPADISENFDRYLNETFHAEPLPARRPPHQRRKAVRR